MASFEQRGKLWSVRYHDALGERRRQGGFSTLREAKAWMLQREDEIGRGVTHDRGMTLDQLAERFLAQHEASDGTITRLRCALKHSRDKLGHRPVLELTKDEISRWRKGLPSDSIRHSSTRALKQALNYAVHDLRIIATSPAARVKNPDPGPEEEFVPFRDWAQVLAIDAKMPEWCRGWIVVLVGTGLRPQEWPKLRWEHVDLEARCLRLTSSVVKHNTPARIVPLRKLAFEWLMANRKSSGLVFAARDGGPLRLDKWRDRTFYDAQEAAGVDRRRPYDMRHTYATWALRAGLNTHTLARRMGTSLKMIDRTYGHLAHDSETHERMLMDSFDEIASLPEASGPEVVQPVRAENLSGSIASSASGS